MCFDLHPACHGSGFHSLNLFFLDVAGFEPRINEGCHVQEASVGSIIIFLIQIAGDCSLGGLAELGVISFWFQDLLIEEL